MSQPNADPTIQNGMPYNWEPKPFSPYLNNGVGSSQSSRDASPVPKFSSVPLTQLPPARGPIPSSQLPPGYSPIGLKSASALNQTPRGSPKTFNTSTPNMPKNESAKKFVDVTLGSAPVPNLGDSKGFAPRMSPIQLNGAQKQTLNQPPNYSHYSGNLLTNPQEQITPAFVPFPATSQKNTVSEPQFTNVRQGQPNMGQFPPNPAQKSQPSGPMGQTKPPSGSGPSMGQNTMGNNPSMGQPGSGMSDSSQNMGQTSSNMTPSGPNMGQPTSMSRPVPNMGQAASSMAQNVPNMGQHTSGTHHVPNMGQPATSISQSGTNMGQPTSMSHPVPNMGQAASSVAQNVPNMGQHTSGTHHVPNMGQPATSISQSGPNMGQPTSMSHPVPNMGQPDSSMAQNIPNMGQASTLGQSQPAMGQNVPQMGQPMPNMGPPTTMGQSVPPMGQPASSMSQPGPNMGPPVSSTAQTVPNMGPPPTMGQSVPQMGPPPSSMAQTVPNMGQPNPAGSQIPQQASKMPPMTQNPHPVMNMGTPTQNMGLGQSTGQPQQNINHFKMSTPGQSPNMGQNVPVIGQGMNQQPNLLTMGQNPPMGSQNQPNMGQNVPVSGQSMGQPPNLLTMGQNQPPGSQNQPNMGQKTPVPFSQMSTGSQKMGHTSAFAAVGNQKQFSQSVGNLAGIPPLGGNMRMTNPQLSNSSQNVRQMTPTSNIVGQNIRPSQPMYSNPGTNPAMFTNQMGAPRPTQNINQNAFASNTNQYTKSGNLNPLLGPPGMMAPPTTTQVAPPANQNAGSQVFPPPPVNQPQGRLPVANQGPGSNQLTNQTAANGQKLTFLPPQALVKPPVTNQGPGMTNQGPGMPNQGNQMTNQGLGSVPLTNQMPPMPNQAPGPQLTNQGAVNQQFGPPTSENTFPTTPTSTLHGKRYPQQAYEPNRNTTTYTSTYRQGAPNQTYQQSYGQNYQSLNQGMTNMNLQQTGLNRLWGAENFDLLQCPNILPQEKIEAPRVSLGQDFLDAANCSPDIFRCTMTKIPESSSLLQKSRLPLGVLIHPFRDLNHLPVIQCSTIVRCRACRTYINPFVFFVDTKRWKCNLCYRVNELPEEFQYDPVSKSYGDPSRRPEIKSSTIEYIAPSEYMLRPPQPAVYLFLLDISRLAIESGYLHTICETLTTQLSSLPGDSRTQVGFLAYDSALHFFSLGDGLSRPHELLLMDIEEAYLPRPDGLLVNLAERKDLVLDLLALLPSREPGDTGSALGAALRAAFKMMSSTGGRVTVFQCALPTVGPGALTSREDPNQRAGKEAPHLNPATDFYKRLALECSGHQVAVDLFVLNSQYVDIATLSGISRFSGGCMHHFPLFNAAKALHSESLERCFKRYLTRKIGFEAVMRIRCTRGLAVHTFHGNFFVRSTDLLSLPNVNPDAGFGMQVSIEESLSDLQSVCFQAALLYTSSKGERRIRVHTLCLPVVNTLTDVLNSADQQCIVGILSKMAVDRSLQSSLSDARDAFINVAIDILHSYKVSLNMGDAGNGLLASHSLKLLPLYILALLKHVAFRSGTSTRLDDRVHAMCEMKSLPLGQLLQQVYPDLYPVHNLSDDGAIIDPDGVVIPQPPRVQLTARNIDANGVYLLDAGQTQILFVCRDASPTYITHVLGQPSYARVPDLGHELPRLDNQHSQRLHAFLAALNDEKPYCAQLHVMRENSPNRTMFLERLIEDRIESALSYNEFLQHIKTQVK